MQDKTRLLEEAYFHTGNSGVTARIVENNSGHYKNRDIPRYDYRLQIRHGAFGHNSEFSTPLFDSGHVRALIEMLERTALLMDQVKLAGLVYESPLERQGPRSANSIRSGQRFDPIHEEYVASEYTMRTMYIGDRVTDATSGQFIREDIFDFPIELPDTSGSTESVLGNVVPPEKTWREEDIGLPCWKARALRPVAIRDSGRERPSTFYIDTGASKPSVAEATVKIMKTEFNNKRSKP